MGAMETLLFKKQLFFLKIYFHKKIGVLIENIHFFP